MVLFAEASSDPSILLNVLGLIFIPLISAGVGAYAAEMMGERRAKKERIEVLFSRMWGNVRTATRDTETFVEFYRKTWDGQFTDLRIDDANVAFSNAERAGSALADEMFMIEMLLEYNGRNLVDGIANSTYVFGKIREGKLKANEIASSGDQILQHLGRVRVEMGVVWHNVSVRWYKALWREVRFRASHYSLVVWDRLERHRKKAK